MSQEITETEDFLNDFSPLDAPVKRRSYTNHNVNYEGQTFDDLEEPTYEQPNIFLNEEEQAEPEKRVFNESYSELDGKEKTMGAEMMAEMTLDLYTKGCEYMGKIPQISESKLDKLILEGDIDANIEIPTESGIVGVKDFAKEFNSSISGAFEVDDEFRDKVRPPLIRVFKKRGVGMTDEQLLLYYFGTDLFTKGAQAFMLKKTANSVIDSLKENTLAIRESVSYSQTPRPKQQPKEQEKELEETYEVETPQPKPARKTKAQPKTNLQEQVEYFEPEENGSSVFDNLKDTGGFVHETQDIQGMPTFGDADILSEIEKIASQDIDSKVDSVKRRRTTLGVNKRKGKK